jgi:NitT/TauT family transport system ATP-binding protein
MRLAPSSSEAQHASMDGSSDGTAISIEGASKEFETKSGQSVRALSELTFTVRAGEFVSLVGPSGCGKSTTLRLVAGLQPPSTGRLILNGEVVDAPRREVGMMFQTPTLLPWRTTLKNVLLPIEVARGADMARARERAKELLKVVGLEGFEEAHPRELSGGMQQRAAVARLLISDPEILLLDEPFGALDELTRDQMDLELLRIWQGTGKTVLLVTHSINEAVFMSDRVLVFSPRPGQIVADLTMDLPRPRTSAVLSQPQFQGAVADVRRALGLET